MKKNMQRIIKVFTVLILISFSGHVLAEGVKRPGPNNKLGHTKSNQGDTFFDNLFDYEDTKATRAIADNNDRVIQQIKMLSELREEGILSNSEFEEKKKILLKKIK
tara:strand:+ start:173 stop:490 length:318 start_codon:yes stop_codon:yes gene_type:complete